MLYEALQYIQYNYYHVMVIIAILVFIIFKSRGMLLFTLLYGIMSSMLYPTMTFEFFSRIILYGYALFGFYHHNRK